MNDNEKGYWQYIGVYPEIWDTDRKSLGELAARPEGQALYARLKAAAERMDAHIPRSYKRTDPTWGEAHRDELPDIVEYMCGETVRRWSWGEKRNYPRGGTHLCPLDEPKAEHSKQPKAPVKTEAKPAAKTKPEDPDTLSGWGI